MAADKMINGVNVTELGKAIHQFRAQPGLSDFLFRTRTEWDDGGHCITEVTQFHGVGQENNGRSFTLESDEPVILLGKDQAPNPVEHQLHALATCMTAALAYHAASRGIRIEACECSIEGQIDLRGYLGISEDVRKGYQKLDVHFRVESDASAAQLEECIRFSPVLDVTMNGTEVELNVETTMAKGAGAERPTVEPSGSETHPE